MRAVAQLLLVHFCLVLLAPAAVVADFWIERERVEQELCVQRLVKEEVRTCHGQCYLMKQLNRSEQRAQDLPQQLRSLKLGDMAVQTIAEALVPLAEERDRGWGQRKVHVLAGHPDRGEPVPWG